MSREEVLNCFERNRKLPGATFDESHFIDYLLSNPKYEGAIHNSFEGKRRFFKFWKEVQLEQGVCFALADQEKKYSLDAFVKRVEQLKNNPKSSKAALRHQMKFGFEWNILIFMNVILTSIVATTLKWPFISAPISVLAIFANYKHISYHFSEKAYLQKLWAKLGE